MNYRSIVRGLLVVLLALVFAGLPELGTATRLVAWAQSSSGNGHSQLTERTAPMFDLNADWTDPDQFYHFPYPSDLRLDDKGHPDLSGFPTFTGFIGFFKRLKTIASDRPKFPTTAAAYFRFNQPLSPQSPDQLIPTEPNAPLLLIDVDPDSPQRGQLMPIVASTPDPDPYYVPPHLLAVAPYPGIVLEPNHQYAYVVRRSLRDAKGQPLKSTSVFQQMRQGRLPSGLLKHKFAAYFLYQPLWQTLDQVGINRNSVVSATVFTTGDVVAEMAQLSDRVLTRYHPPITKVKYAPEKRISDLGYCQFEAQIKLPDFQKGSAPFLAFEKRDGLFEQTATGDLVQFGSSTIPVVITLPKTPMPLGGYPLVAYYHGSGGISSQVVDRGAVLKQGGKRLPGRGPADVVARYGFAAVGSALPVNPQRVFRPISNLLNGRAYLNPTNPSAYRDTFRQGVIEQRL
ncbi:MAG: hypothetical protein AB4042_05735, partial [Leptolyngbyaceae cyanobacterium]